MRIVLSSLLMMFTAVVAADEPVQIKDPYVRAAPPGATALAAYMKLENNSGKIEVLKSISSKQFDAVELHSNVMEDNVMKMRRLSSVELPAGATLSFAPGGLHLMLINPHHTLAPGDKINLELTFASGTVVMATAEVRDMRDEGQVMNHDHMQHQEQQQQHHQHQH